MSEQEHPMSEQPEQEDQTTDEQRQMLQRLRDEAQQALKDGQPQPPEHGYDLPPPPDDEGHDTYPVEYVFAVYYDRTAGAVAVAALDKVVVREQEGETIRLVPEREATPDDMWRGASEVCKDIETAQTANQVAQTMMHMSAAAQQQMAVRRQQEQQAQKEAVRLSEAARRGGAGL